MRFYELLSRYYDIIFPATDTEIAFLDSHIDPVRHNRVLDIGCAVGGHSMELAKLGFNVTGIDPDESMIGLAREKVEKADFSHLKGRVGFETGDARNLRFENGSFDAVICLGNTLAHLLTEEEIMKALNEIQRVLVPGGRLIVQIVNYDRIMKRGATELPLIENKEAGLVFKRIYTPLDSERLRFDYYLNVKGVEARESIFLRPILFESLKRYLDESGFVGAEFFGGFNGSPYSEESPALIAVAKIK